MTGASAPRTAWSLIGWDDGEVRIQGGRAVYDAVSYWDDTPGDQVSLQRIDVAADGRLRVVRWYVDPDTLLVPASPMAEDNWTYNTDDEGTP